MNNKKYSDEAICIRRQLHKIPELGFCEFKTQQYILEYLKELGYEPLVVAQTGVLCFIDYGHENTIALRCDMDALPISEAVNSEYKSEHMGVMHACGHDAHMSMLLTVAKYLHEEDFIPSSNVLLIFQPAEEGPGGAQIIVNDGILEKYKVSKIYGFHLFPGVEYGKIACRSGEFFAGSVEVYFKIKGEASHGAQPHIGRDALAACANLVIQLNAISAKAINPLDDVVLCIGKMDAGDRLNIIASHASIEGTLRSFNESVKNKMLTKIQSVCDGIAISFGVDVEFEPIPFYPPVINNDDVYNEVKMKLESELVEAEKVMLSEDFSYYAQKVPALFMLLGIDDGNSNHRNPLHSDNFDFNDDVLFHGIKAYIKLLQ